MRKVFLTTLLSAICIINKTNAQFVTIPDTNFVTFLQQNYPTAMVGNQMDTTDASVVGATSLDCSFKNISDVYGIDFFDSLAYFNCGYNLITTINNLPLNLSIFLCNNNLLTNISFFPQTLSTIYCHNNQLVNLPSLPNNLLSLTCGTNQLDSLPSIPNSLSLLDCQENQITSIPYLPTGLKFLIISDNGNIVIPSLPSGLELFHCGSNYLNVLPSLPNTLKFLDCKNNSLTTLPATLPDSLNEINILNNSIAILPSLPPNLNILICGNNSINSLPALPNNLTHLLCYGNLLSSLPNLPTNLIQLWCFSNQLTSLPNLPNSIKSLVCSNNFLTNISIPDSLKELNCIINNITCIPNFIQDTFDVFMIFSGNNITCIPKTFYSISSDSSIYLPLCTGLSGCLPLAQVSGNVHLDTSLNCALDSLQNGDLLQNAKMTKWINNSMIDQAYVSANNQYYFNAIVGDTITIKMDTSGMPFYLNCPSIGYRTVEITPLDSVRQHQDFSVKCKLTPDLNVQSIFGTFRNAQARNVNISAGDLSKFYKINCVNNIGGTVTTTITGPASFVGAASGALTPVSVVGNTINYTVADFGTLNYDSAFGIIVMADTFAPINSSVCIKTIVNTVTDVNQTNDTLEFCGLVTNSYDPNDKACSPTNTATPNTWLTYTVRFQNTGNDTAYNIIIRDTLDTNLDASSFTYLASSHNPIISLEGNAASFNFKNINLVDSFSNEPLSHGYIQYKVKTKSSLPLNASVKNTASIYFDFNDAIVTNTTTNTYGLDTPLGVGILTNTKNNFSLYPNPSADYISIKTTNAGTIKIMDLIGGVHQVLNVSAYKTQSIAVKYLSKGIYIVQFIDSHGSATSKKFIKE
jgi:uncharacterized repeat protein (TIGR01451 family)